jgi:sec-independent protein translocase protein TatC
MWQGILTKVFKVREKVAMNLGSDDEEKPFLEHLDDLRKMIVRVITTLVIATIGTFCFYKPLFQMILRPLIWAGIASDIDHAKTILINIGAPDAFMTVVNVSLIAAVIVSFPIILIFILQFVLPGLKPNEKKMIFPGLAIATALFLVGVAFAYQMVLPRALKFFEEFGTDLGIKQTWTLESYITFSTRFILIFGVSFELPVVVMGLVKLDFLGYKTMKNTRRHAAIIIAVFSAVITPTQDIMTLLLLVLPLYFLYEVCIWLAYYMEKKDRTAFPEYYAELDKDEKALDSPAPDEWDNENYNPWFSDDDNKGDEDEYQRPRATPSAPPPEVEKGSTSSEDPFENTGEDQSSQVIEDDVPEAPAPETPVPETPAPEAAPEEKTLEDLAREDESRPGNPNPPTPPTPQ